MSDHAEDQRPEEPGDTGHPRAPEEASEPGASSKIARVIRDAIGGPINVRSIALTGIFVIIALAAMRAARPVLVPLALAMMLAMMLSPIVRGLRLYFRIPAALGAGLLLLGATASVAAIGWTLSEPAAEMVSDVPFEIERLERKFRGWTEGVEDLREAGKQMEEMTRDADSETVKVRVQEPSVTEFVFGQTWYIIATGFLTLGLLYFLLAADDLFLQKLVKVTPTLEDKKVALKIVRDIHDDLRWYFLDITLINIGLGVAVGLAMWLLGMPFPALWGVMATLLNFIPFAGALVGVMIVALAAAATFDGVGQILLVPGVYYTLTSLEGSFITPMILGRKLVLNPVIIFIALIFWGWMWGIPGIFLAVPIVSAVKIVCDHITPFNVVGEFLGR